MTERFKTIYREHIKRPGADRLLEWLGTTDFFTAPASTRFHGAYPGGLCKHSLNVYHRLSGTVGETESVAIVALLHDICKANFYKLTTRNVKNERTGQWEKVPYYTVEEQLPFGHGEKSVYLIMQHMPLTEEEAVAIRYHMGNYAEEKSTSAAFEKYPLALYLHQADEQATYIDEKRGI